MQRLLLQLLVVLGLFAELPPWSLSPMAASIFLFALLSGTSHEDPLDALDPHGTTSLPSGPIGIASEASGVRGAVERNRVTLLQ